MLLINQSVRIFNVAKSTVTELVMSDDNVRKWLLKQECLQLLAKGCNRWWWLDMDRQSVPDSCGCNRKRATANAIAVMANQGIHRTRCKEYHITSRVIRDIGVLSPNNQGGISFPVSSYTSSFPLLSLFKDFNSAFHLGQWQTGFSQQINTPHCWLFSCTEFAHNCRINYSNWVEKCHAYDVFLTVYWNRVIFSDECEVETELNNQAFVWRKVREEWSSQCVTSPPRKRYRLSWSAAFRTDCSLLRRWPEIPTIRPNSTQRADQSPQGVSW